MGKTKSARRNLIVIQAMAILLSILVVNSAYGKTVDIPVGIMDAAVASGDAKVIVRDYLFPMLEYDPVAMIVFAAEQNISNGSPYTRDFGERGIFGKLVSVETAWKEIDILLGNLDPIYDEMHRLLFGPWNNSGNTTYSFASSSGVRALSYDTGKWVKARNPVDVIRVRHVTEYYNIVRYALIECNWSKPTDGYYECNFRLLRK